MAELTVRDLEQYARRLRGHILQMGLTSGAASAHLGGALSYADIAATLFGKVMRLDPKNPEWEGRDRFILSKGHGVLGCYAALHEVGYLSADDLATIKQPGSFLLGHPVKNRAKGIEFSTGSLGMGLSLGIGVALAARKRHQDFNVYVLLGDGECNEGSVWEAAMAAAQYGLTNLTAIIDRNRLQQTGSNQDIMSLGNIAAKWASFSWEVVEINGHDIAEIDSALTSARTFRKPRAIIAHTTKGRGVSFMENNNDWHHATLTPAQFETAMNELGTGRGNA